MREVTYFNKNIEKWRRFDSLISEKRERKPDELADIYIELTDDLAFAQSHFPDTKTEQYLNQLTVKVHDTIHSSKKEEFSRFITFWTKELPVIYGKRQKEMLYALILFFLFIMIGAFSQHNESEFTRAILGDAYVNMTITNIEEGDPFAVYKSQRQMDMFFGITLNNIRVSFNAFILGMLTAFGTGYFMLVNGVMIGSFLQFFNEFDLFADAIRVVFIHGTLEISAIIIAGGAGFVLGNSFIFPGTFTRKRSFVIGVKDGVKMIIGLIPVFIAAGFLESFVTRYTELPLLVSALIILLSLAFVIYYYAILPNKAQPRSIQL